MRRRELLAIAAAVAALLAPLGMAIARLVKRLEALAQRRDRGAGEQRRVVNQLAPLAAYSALIRPRMFFLCSKMVVGNS